MAVDADLLRAAKAEALGSTRGGLMERAERLAFLAFGLLFESLLVPVLW
jgi:hypothetical protein